MSTPTHGERRESACSGGSPPPCLSWFSQPFCHIPLLCAGFLAHMGEAIAHIKVLPKVILFIDITKVDARAPCLDKCLTLMEQCSPNPLPDVGWTQINAE